MKYLKVKFKVSCNKGFSTEEQNMLVETAKAILCDSMAEAGFETFIEEDGYTAGYVQERLLDRQVMDDNINTFPINGVSVEYEIEKTEDKNWNETWESQGFEPITVKDKCVIHDTIHHVEVGNNVMDVTIDTKQAFGTGTHETTYMIVSELLKMDLTGKKILDCGCGTGILSIVAAKSGASKVTAYDIDEWSVRNTMHNSELNGVDNITVLHGDASLLAQLNDKFDVVMANINRNILLADMPAFVKVMADEATLILSGFYEEDSAMLVDKATALGLVPLRKEVRNNWCMLSLLQKQVDE